MGDKKSKGGSQWITDNYNELASNYAGQVVLVTGNGVVASGKDYDEAFDNLPENINMGDVTSHSVPTNSGPAIVRQ